MSLSMLRNIPLFAVALLGLLHNAYASEQTQPDVGIVLKTYKIYHSTDSGPSDTFSPRGTIRLSTPPTGSDDEGIVASVEHEENCLSDAAEQIDALVSSEGFYRIKLVDEDNGRSVLASVPGCDFRRSNFRENISLSISHTGSLISISYAPQVSPLALACSELPPMSSKEFEFQTTVTYTTATQGMPIPVVMPPVRPPGGYSWIKRKNKPGQANGAVPGTTGGSGNPNTFDPNTEEGGKPENMSFLRKYWYIALPLTIMTLFGGTEEAPPQGGGGQGGAAASAVQSSAAMAAASVAAGSAPKKRRGKKG